MEESYLICVKLTQNTPVGNYNIFGSRIFQLIELLSYFLQSCQHNMMVPL